jgi:integrase/recombinase XerD
MQSRQGVLHFRVQGKRGKVRFVPVQVRAQRLIEEYLARAGHGADGPGAVFRPVTNNRTGDLDRPLDPASVYQNIVRKYGLETGISAQVNGLCVHSLRATAATNALSHEADIAKVQGGSAMLTSPPHACTIAIRRGRRTVLLFALVRY